MKFGFPGWIFNSASTKMPFVSFIDWYSISQPSMLRLATVNMLFVCSFWVAASKTKWNQSCHLLNINSKWPSSEQALKQWTGTNNYNIFIIHLDILISIHKYGIWLHIDSTLSSFTIVKRSKFIKQPNNKWKWSIDRSKNQNININTLLLSRKSIMVMDMMHSIIL